MKILVTGCMGFIGSNVVPNLLNEGHEVIGFDNLSNPSINPTDRMKAASGQNWKNFKFYKVDILTLETMFSILANDPPDYIVHLAAVGSVPRSFETPGHTMMNNVIGFTNMVQIASHFKVKRFVFASSSSVYGDISNVSRTEAELGKCLSPYALSKVQNEELARIWATGGKFEYVGLRFFNVYGPGQRADSEYSAAIPKFINGQAVIIYGDGENTRDFTYVSDVSNGIQCALFANGSPSPVNGIYNICTGEGTSINKLASLCSKKTPTYLPPRHGDVKSSIGAPFAAQLYLKFHAIVDIEEGIQKTIRYYESLKGIETL
jgi:UDP-N-acetylglucosamine 4-epimerase